jgi:hypothetical protein
VGGGGGERGGCLKIAAVWSVDATVPCVSGRDDDTSGTLFLLALRPNASHGPLIHDVS